MICLTLSHRHLFHHLPHPFLRVFLEFKDEWQFRRLGCQYCWGLLFDCGRKWIQRVVSVWRAKLSGESESLVANVLRISVTGGSGHVCPRKLNRPPLLSGNRRRLWSIRRRRIVCRIEFPSGWNEWEFSSGWNELEFPSGWNEWEFPYGWSEWEFPSGWNELEFSFEWNEWEFPSGWNERCRVSIGGLVHE